MGTHPPLVTISASYGAGGSRIAPAVAERLGVDFVQRAMPAGIAERLATPLREARREQQHPGRSLGRLLRQIQVEQTSPGEERFGREVDEDEQYRFVTERMIRAHVDSGAVVLGRAGAFVLRDVRHALHVRLGGPRGRRIELAMERGGIDEATARWRQTEGDLARDEYVRHFYGADPADPSLYHVTWDTTRTPLDVCVDAIVATARSFARAAGS